MTALQIAGLSVSIILIVAAGIVAHTPWRVHGGRFVTEYLLLAAAIAAVGLIVALGVLAFSL